MYRSSPFGNHLPSALTLYSLATFLPVLVQLLQGTRYSLRYPAIKTFCVRFPSKQERVYHTSTVKFRTITSPQQNYEINLTSEPEGLM
jgi:ABC-type antimicrobial peptide transport system ATPase subunit